MLLSAIVGLAMQPVGLKPAAAWGGRLTVRFHDRAAEIDETHVIDLGWKVSGKEERRWSVEQKRRLIETVVDGTRIPPLDNRDPAVERGWLNLDGALVGQEPFDLGGFLLERLLHVWMPEGAGKTWDLVLPALGDRFVPSGTFSFRVLPSGDLSRRYSFFFKELGPYPIEARGAAEFSTKTGQLLKLDAEAARVLLPGGTIRVGATVSYRDATLSARQ